MNLKKKMKKILYLFPVKWINKFYLFYNRIFYPELVERKMSFGEKNEDALSFIGYLQDFIERRKQEMPQGSYTTSLFQSGINRMAQKVGEEAVETVIEATKGTDDRLIYEASDLLYHLIVLLTSKGYRIEDLVRELQKRHQ